MWRAKRVAVAPPVPRGRLASFARPSASAARPSGQASVAPRPLLKQVARPWNIFQRRTFASESKASRDEPAPEQEPDFALDDDPYGVVEEEPWLTEEELTDALLDDTQTRQRQGIYRPPLLLSSEEEAQNWGYDFRSLMNKRFRAGKGSILWPSAEDFEEQNRKRSMGWWDRKMANLSAERITVGTVLKPPWARPRRRRRRRRTQARQYERFLMFYYVAENMKAFPLEPPDEQRMYDAMANIHPYYHITTPLRVQRDLNVLTEAIPTQLQISFDNGLVRKVRKFYRTQEEGGMTPMVPLHKPEADDLTETGEAQWKGIPFLTLKDLPVSALAPNNANIWTALREQFNDEIYRRDWRPPATMAWDPLMNYAIPFWVEPRLRRPTGKSRTWRWKHQPHDEPQMRSIFWGPASMNSLDRAMAGSDRLDLPGMSRLDDPHRMITGHRRELRRENAAVMRFQRTLLNDDMERKAEEMWTRGTIAGDRGPVHYDRWPQARKSAGRWTMYVVVLFLLYLLWVTGSANNKFIAEQNWYQHPIVHDRARFHGFRVREMKVNGNGFWHALADQLYGTPEVWNWVKTAWDFMGAARLPAMMGMPIGDPADGTTLLDFQDKTSLPDTNWVKMWIRNLPGDQDQDYRNMEWTGRPGQSLSYLDMSPDYIDMRRDITLLPRVGQVVRPDQEDSDIDEMPYEYTEHYQEQANKYARVVMNTYHPMDHIDMLYVATTMNIRINLLSTAYTIPHSRAWIHIDPAYGQKPRYEVNMLMHYVNGEIVGFDSLVPYDVKHWHGVAMDEEKIVRRMERANLPGNMAAERMNLFEDYVRDQMKAGLAEEAAVATSVSLV